MSSPALSTDDLALTDHDGEKFSYRLQGYEPESMAVAFERLAAEVRKGINGVMIQKFNINSDLCGENFLTQTLTIEVEVMHPDKPGGFSYWSDKDKACAMVAG